MANKIICRFCAAEFDEMLPQCPYCRSTNYKGAEAEYFEKLNDVREDMEELQEVPEQETRKAFRKQGKILLIVFAVIRALLLLAMGWTLFMDSLYQRDEKTEFLWKQEHFPLMNELYEQGKYDEVKAFYLKSIEEEAPVGEWEHADFCGYYITIQYLHNLFAEEAAGEDILALESGDVDATKRIYTGILYDEWKIIGIPVAGLDEQERAILAAYEEDILKDFEIRWNMSEEDYQSFYCELEENGGWVSHTSCEEYVENWYDGR